ncbi:MAG: UDP-N-acetylmuramoyl-L-alanine--D-glutamate ligase [Bacteroidales bacterium]|nr:UDP-N-acetylmuramoyl-L-alanine--D-glutamate ligase [Bacteroidales bacterium]MBQ2109666.1 UDP-N-acetylmuramoyl-L-alanine--D-glutamate ligase [Bacteroidales bacterium]SKC58173.1 UDP-N-acetylmuramoylalanine--D-glutamate ligase [Bacteroidales bacterium WCE2008]
MSRIVVLGGAESGVGAAVLAKVKGFDVFLSDKGKIDGKYVETLKKWDIPFEQGQHTEELILNADEVIKSPGIPSTVPMVKKIEEKGIGIISEIEFAGRYDTAKKICITGSNGKTTTTSLIYYLLQQAGLNVGLGGNIGMSYAYQVATEKHDYYVLEISSFQLDNCYDFRPDIAIITNITPDHLDRYDYKMENYVKSKFRIIRNLRPEDCFIFDSDDEITINHLSQIVTQAKLLPFTQKDEVKQGAFLKDDKIVIRYEKDETDIYLEELALGGKHNIYNSMAAALAAKASGIDNKTIREGLSTFQAIEHRLEPVLSVGGVLYINDSKATNVDAAWYALECQKRPVVWIVGGTDKGNDYSVLTDLVRDKVKAIVCLGVDNHKFYEAFESIVGKDKMVETRSAEEAVKAASKFAVDGDVVLLSPCCASFDLFTCYEDRGEKFKEAVRNL